MFEEMNRMDEMLGEMLRKPRRKSQAGTPPFVYGFSFSLDPEGRPTIRQFGNLEPSRRGLRTREEREPLVDVLDENNEIVVVAEIPGVGRDDIRLKSGSNWLEISVDAAERKYYKRLELPSTVDANSLKPSYKNGVLEARLQKLKGTRTERTSLRPRPG